MFLRGGFDQIFVDPTIFLDGMTPGEIVETFCQTLGNDVYESLQRLRPPVGDMGGGDIMAHQWYVREQLIGLLDGDSSPTNEGQSHLLQLARNGERIDLSLSGFEGDPSPPLLRCVEGEDGDTWFLAFGNGEEESVPTVREAIRLLTKRLSVSEQ